MSFGGVAVTVLVLAGGFAVLPPIAPAQVTPAPDVPAVAPGQSTTPPVAPVADPGPEDRPAPSPRCGPDEDPDEESLRDLQPTAADAQAPDPDAEVASGEPIARCSQNAGDQQYKDPFAGSKPPKDGGGSNPSGDGSQSPADGSQSSGDQSAAPTSVLAEQSLAGAGDAGEAAGDPGATLPNSGLDAGPLCAAGLALLLAGAGLRRRIA